MNFSVLNWNIEGSKYYTSTKLRKVIPHLEKSTADIFCLQEAQELREKIILSDKFSNFNYAFPKNKEDRNIILSKFPIINSGEISFPVTIYSVLEKAIWADIKINEELIRIYNCHLEIVGIGPKQRLEQLNFILEDAKQHQGPVIVCGDMNTTIPAAGYGRKFIKWFHKVASDNLITDQEYLHLDERHFFLKKAELAGFKDAVNLHDSTWCLMPLRWEIFKLKLDWFLIRNIEKPEVSLGKYVSDHRSILAKF